MPALTALEIAEHVKEILDTTEPERQKALRSRLINIVVSAMSPDQNLAYGYLASREWASSAQVAGIFGWKVNYASNILMSLFELGLVERQAVTDRLSVTGRFGLHYQWRVKPLS